jgi:hypothetical protein
LFRSSGQNWVRIPPIWKFALQRIPAFSLLEIRETPPFSKLPIFARQRYRLSSNFLSRIGGSGFRAFVAMAKELPAEQL